MTKELTMAKTATDIDTYDAAVAKAAAAAAKGDRAEYQEGRALAGARTVAERAQFARDVSVADAQNLAKGK